MLKQAVERRLESLDPPEPTAAQLADKANRLRLYQAALDRRRNMKEAALAVRLDDEIAEDPFFGSSNKAESAKKAKRERKEQARRRRNGDGGTSTKSTSRWGMVKENLDELEQYE